MVGSDHAPGALAPQGEAARAWRMHNAKVHAACCRMDRLSRRGARRNPDLIMKTCEAVRGAPALPEDGPEVRCTNAIHEFFPLRVQWCKQELQRRTSERDTDA